MDNRIIFREMLTELKVAADEKEGILTHGEIREILKSMPLEEEHFQLIYEYLEEQNIRVVESREELSKIGEGEGICLAGPGEAMSDAGQPCQSDEAMDDETVSDSRQSLSFYLEELEKLAPVDDAEEMRLIDRARAGDDGAKEQLIGIYLPLICSMAEEYGEETMSGEDLIQEGNLGLLLAVDSLGEFDNAAACRAWMINMARKAMEDAVKSSQDGQKMDDGLLSRINHLNEAVHNLERDLGHKVSAEEVSAYLE
ncbi:MAG: hypothetical protein LUI87_17400, partial [Lachnospiraceae bacterium]|nr:hypothetical protein [Lachnospiraceae bacterium]